MDLDHLPIVRATPQNGRTMKEAAEDWKVSRGQIRQWIAEGKIEAVQYKGCRMRTIYVLTRKRPALG